MSDFDDILKQMRASIDGIAEEARQKYNDLCTYLDSHDSEEIKENLRKMADQVVDNAKEGIEGLRKEVSEIDMEEKVREVVDSGIEKAKTEAAELKADYEEGRLHDKVEEVREGLQKGAGEAMDQLGEGLEVVQKQWNELRKRLGI